MNEAMKYTLDEIMTPTEAAEKWGLANGATIRKSIERGKFHDGEIKRSGNVWLLTPDAMYRVFGEPKVEATARPKAKPAVEPVSTPVPEGATVLSDSSFAEDMHTADTSAQPEPVRSGVTITIDFNELQRKAYEYYMQSDKMEAYVIRVFTHAAERLIAGDTVSLQGFSLQTGGDRSFTDFDQYMEWVDAVGQYFSLTEATIDTLRAVRNS